MTTTLASDTPRPLKPWQIPPEESKRASDELDVLQKVAGCVDLSSIGLPAFAKANDGEPFDDDDRYAVNCDFVFRRVVLDARDVGKLAEGLESALYDVGMQCLQAADAINCYRQPIQLTDAAGPDAASDDTDV